jgi:hypothetical protein
MHGQATPTGRDRWIRAFVNERATAIDEGWRSGLQQRSGILRIGYIWGLRTGRHKRGRAVLRVRDKRQRLWMSDEGCHPLRLWDEGQGVLRVGNKRSGSRTDM